MQFYCKNTALVCCCCDKKSITIGLQAFRVYHAKISNDVSVYKLTQKRYFRVHIQDIWPRRYGQLSIVISFSCSHVYARMCQFGYAWNFFPFTFLRGLGLFRGQTGRKVTHILPCYLGPIYTIALTHVIPMTIW